MLHQTQSIAPLKFHIEQGFPSVGYKCLPLKDEYYFRDFILKLFLGLPITHHLQASYIPVRISGCSQCRIQVSAIEGWVRVRVRQQTFVSQSQRKLLYYRKVC